MRKILTLLLASMSLVGCQSGDSSSSTAVQSEDLVSIAPRAVRTSSITDSLYNATSLVRATILDKDDNVLASREAAFAAKSMSLPPVEASLDVKVRLEGFDASGILLWSGTSGLQKAKDHESIGVRASKDGGTGVQIYKRLVEIPGVDPGVNLDSLVTARLLGHWLTQVSYQDDAGETVVLTAYLALYSDGVYALNQLEQYQGFQGAYAGLFEVGAWAVADGLVGLVPTSMKTCLDNLNGTNCQISLAGTPNGLNPLYLDGIATTARFYSLDLYSDRFVVTDLFDSTNIQTWFPNNN